MFSLNVMLRYVRTSCASYRSFPLLSFLPTIQVPVCKYISSESSSSLPKGKIMLSLSNQGPDKIDSGYFLYTKLFSISK